MGAAATALTVKGALAGPVGSVAEAPLNDARNTLVKATDADLSGSRAIADQVVHNVEAALTHSPTRGATNSTPPTSVPKQAAAPPSTPSRASGTYSRTLARKILREAAIRHGIDPRLVLALSFWESGWDQSRVSETGAVGLMQVEPSSADEAGPALLGRHVDLTNPYDNADVGAAILREDLDQFKNPATALAAYYQGPTSLKQNGMLPDTQQYVDGILSLAAVVPDR